MKLGNFIDEFIAKNSLINLWKKCDEHSHEMLTSDSVMEWELMEIPELSKLQVIHIRSILCEGDYCDAINIAIETDYSRADIASMISKFREKRYSVKVCESVEIKKGCE